MLLYKYSVPQLILAIFHFAPSWHSTSMKQVYTEACTYYIKLKVTGINMPYQRFIGRNVLFEQSKCKLWMMKTLGVIYQHCLSATIQVGTSWQFVTSGWGRGHHGRARVLCTTVCTCWPWHDLSVTLRRHWGSVQLTLRGLRIHGMSHVGTSGKVWRTRHAWLAFPGLPRTWWQIKTMRRIPDRFHR